MDADGDLIQQYWSQNKISTPEREEPLCLAVWKLDLRRSLQVLNARTHGRWHKEGVKRWHLSYARRKYQNFSIKSIHFQREKEKTVFTSYPPTTLWHCFWADKWSRDTIVSQILAMILPMMGSASDLLSLVDYCLQTVTNGDQYS